MRRNPSQLFLGLIILCLASLVIVALGEHASAAPPGQVGSLSVIISEVAWAGTQFDANDQWIELYNPGTVDIDLNGWRLVSSDGTPDITFDNALGNTIIRAGDFFLLERTDDTTVSDVSLDYIPYTGALNTAGEILFLCEVAVNCGPSGTVIDTANNDGTIDWPAGSTTGPRSMERIAVVADGAGAWVTNDGITINGHDAALTPPGGNPILGTPRQPNSAWEATATPTDTGTPTATGTATNTSTSTATSTPTPTGTATHTATATLMPPAHIVISEFRLLGPGGASDEFIELFNPSAASVNIGNWQIRKFSCTGTSPSILLTISANTFLQAGQHYLLVNTAASVGSPDQTYSSSLAADNGIAILASNGDIIDQVGVCSDPVDNDYYVEGDALDTLPDYPQGEDESYQRKLGGCVDTDDNADDFAIITPVNPQNRASQATICAGAVTPTPSRTPTPTRTSTPTKTRAPTPVPTAVPVEVVINEFLPHPRTDWNADGKANFADEYIEIINISSRSVSLSGWRLDDDVDGSSAYSLPKVTLLPRQIIHFYASETGISLSDGGDTVRLIGPGGVTIDAYTYPVVLNVDVTWCRLPDGTGTWGFVCHPSPGNPNTRLESGQPSSGGYSPGEGTSICLGGDVPEGILQAECSPGRGIWNWELWGSETEAWFKWLGKWLIVYK